MTTYIFFVQVEAPELVLVAFLQRIGLVLQLLLIVRLLLLLSVESEFVA